MRIPGWPLATLLLVAPVLAAQQPQAQPPVRPAAAGQPPAIVPANPAADPRLEALLQQWEAKMKTIQALEATVQRTETDNVVKAKDVSDGWVRFLRPNRADLFLVKRTNPPQDPKNPQIFERFLCSGSFLYEFSPPNKVIRIHQIPQRAPGQPAMDNSFLSFLSGMEASEAKRRYEFQLKDNPADKWWHYLIVKPRLAADQAEFQTARVVLHSQAQPAQAYLPKQMILVQPNGNELQWDVKEINPAASVPATYFVKPPLPPGWKFVDEVPPNVPPPVRGGPQLPAGNVPPPSKIRQSGGG